ncbi:molecular chaperone, partial [Mycobacterium sp. ITM-2017-0098]
VGDPVPLVLADGSIHRAETLTAAAIEELVRWARPQHRPDVAAVAVPAHWPDRMVGALRAAVPHLRVVSDAAAAFTALQTNPGLPAHGVVALCDFGATGSSITLADADHGFATIGETVRLDVFSGDLVDRAVLQHVLAGLDVDPASTSHVASLGELRNQCRAAKERLSVETATGLVHGRTAIRLTRHEVDTLIAGPLEQFIEALTGMLYRHRIAPAQLAAIATVGGGARIPLVTQRLSETLRRPVITTPYAQVAAAAGAEMLAVRGAVYEAPTTSAPALVQDPTMAAALPLAWSAETVDLAAAD